jgi:hypothetical protein
MPRSICIFNAQTLSWMRCFRLLLEFAKHAYETRANATIFEYEAA